MSDTHPTPTSPYFNLQRNIQYLERSLGQRGRIHHVHRFQEHGTSTILQHATNTRQTPSDEAKLLGGLSTVEQQGQNSVQPSSGGIMSEGRTLVPVCWYCREESSYSFEIKISCCFNIYSIMGITSPVIGGLVDRSALFRDVVGQDRACYILVWVDLYHGFFILFTGTGVSVVCHECINVALVAQLFLK